MESIDVLLVDDVMTDIELTTFEIKKHHSINQIHIERDGQAALDYLFRQGKYEGHIYSLPAVVLLDLALPKLDGMQVLERMRLDVRTAQIPVVILTGSQQFNDMMKAYSFKATRYLPKPISVQYFDAVLSELGL